MVEDTVTFLLPSLAGSSQFPSTAVRSYVPDNSLPLPPMLELYEELLVQIESTMTLAQGNMPVVPNQDASNNSDIPDFLLPQPTSLSPSPMEIQSSTHYSFNKAHVLTPTPPAAPPLPPTPDVSTQEFPNPILLPAPDASPSDVLPSAAVPVTRTDVTPPFCAINAKYFSDFSTSRCARNPR